MQFISYCVTAGFLILLLDRTKWQKSTTYENEVYLINRELMENTAQTNTQSQEESVREDVNSEATPEGGPVLWVSRSLD